MTPAARVLEQAQPLLGEPLSQALLPHEQAGGAAYERGARSSAAALLLVHAVPPCACPLAPLPCLLFALLLPCRNKHAHGRPPVRCVCSCPTLW